MNGRSLTRQFVVAFLITVGIGYLAVRLHLVEQVAYSIEKGRLRALAEALPPEKALEQVNQPNRLVAQLVTPAVVHLEAFRLLTRAEEAELANGSPADSVRFRDMPPGLRGYRPEGGGDREHRREVQTRLGSGFIFDAEHGYVMTNHHVTAEAERLEVILADGRRYPAEVIGRDPETDLAVLSIPAERLHALRFGDSGELAVGDDVFALGNPFGFDGTFSRGIVSALGRSNQIDGVTYKGLIQTDAVVNPGSSGGPLVNRRGEVVGVNTAIATDSGSFTGLAFAIPSARVVRLLPQLVSGGKIVRGFLGVVTHDLRDEREHVANLGWPHEYGVVVRNVLSDSPAAGAGLRPDDILVEVAGEQIDTSTGLMDHVALVAPGAVVTLRFWRRGEFMTSDVAVGRRPDS